MDTNRLLELAGKQACEASCSGSYGQLNLGAFDVDSEWSDDPPPNNSAASISGAQPRHTSVATATEMEAVSPLVRSIFEGRKKVVLGASQKATPKRDPAGGGALWLPEKRHQSRPACWRGVRKNDVEKEVQRKDVELRETFSKAQEEHRAKEMRLRLIINRLKAMNEDLTKQVLEMQEEIRRYESCVLSALDGGGNGLQATSFSKKPCGEANQTLMYYTYTTTS